jgi:hypothetical protein
MQKPYSIFAIVLALTPLRSASSRRDQRFAARSRRTLMLTQLSRLCFATIRPLLIATPIQNRIVCVVNRDNIAGNERGPIPLLIAALALRIKVQLTIVKAAVPLAILYWQRPHTGPTVSRRRCTIVADSAKLTPPALPEMHVLGNSVR